MAGRRQAGPARAPDGFLPFQHPRPVEAPPTGPGWLHEIKFNGYRMQVHVAGGRARFYTRNGHDWSDRFKAQADLAARLGDCVLDAEMIACNAEGYSDFSSLRLKLHRDPDALVFKVDVNATERSALRVADEQGSSIPSPHMPGSCQGGQFHPGMVFEDSVSRR